MHGGALRELRAPRARTAAVALLALAIASCALRAAPSRADGDPASDVLPVQDVFFPYEPNVSHSLEVALEKTVHAAGAAGFPLKVALIGTAVELGLVQQLWAKPQTYAQFLDREISFNQPRRLLVVMPNGFGVVPASLAGALQGVPIDAHARSDGLARAALLAVVALARQAGHPIRAVSASSSGSGGSAPAPLVFGLPVALLALSGLALAVRARRKPGGGRH
jgi:hypothetical protein